MENNKSGQQPAFAAVCWTPIDGYLQEGMSKRFYAACVAMQGILASPNTIMTIKNAKDYAEMAFDFADELLKQENND